MTQEANADENTRVTRVIDFRIPLPYLLTGVGGLGWALISMWFALNQLVKTVDELQHAVKLGNVSVVAVAGELSLIKFRLNNVEDAVKRVAEKQEAKAALK